MQETWMSLDDLQHILIIVLVILKIKDLKTTNRDHKKSKETRCEIVFN